MTVKTEQEIIDRIKFIQEKLSGELSDMDRNNFEKELAECQAEYEEIQQKKEVENKVAEAQAQVYQSFESITVDGQTVTLSELAANETARQILTIYFSQYVTNITAQNEQDKAKLKASYEDQIASKQQQYDALYESSDEQRKKLLQAQAELEDMTARRDAASKQLEEAKAEIARLNSQVDDLRMEIAVGAKSAQNVITNVGGEKLGELIKQLNDSKPAIYDVQSLDNLRKRFTAKLAETDEPIEYGFLESGKYRVVEPQEAAEIADRFRAEQAAQEPAAEDNHADSTLAIAPPSLQFQEGTTDGLATSDTGTQMAGETPVSRAEFEALIYRVARLENEIIPEGVA